MEILDQYEGKIAQPENANGLFNQLTDTQKQELTDPSEKDRVKESPDKSGQKYQKEETKPEINGDNGDGPLPDARNAY